MVHTAPEELMGRICKCDALEAVKTFKGRKYWPYCAIMGTKPSSVTLYKTGDDSKICVNILQFQNFTQGKSKSNTHALTGSNN